MNENVLHIGQNMTDLGLDRPGRRDSRDWRNVASEDRPRRVVRKPRRQGTRQAVIAAAVKGY
jgi:hypothetical protein